MKKNLYYIVFFSLILCCLYHTTSLAANKDQNQNSSSISEAVENAVNGGENNQGNQGANIVGSYQDTKADTRWTKLVASIMDFEDLIKMGTNALFGFAILNGVLCLAISAVRFAGSGSHPMHRRQATLDLVMCAVTTALLGGTKLISMLILQAAFV